MADINVKTSGAVGDGTTDDRAAIQAAINTAIAAGENVYFPPGTYRISKYLDVHGARGLRLYGNAAATVLYPSDNTGVATDAVTNTTANTNQAARSGFLLRYCQDVVVAGLTFFGGTATQISTTNIGVAVYAQHCRGLILDSIVCRNGHAPIAQEATSDTTGTGDSITNASGTTTLVDAAALFHTGHVGMMINVGDTSNPLNQGRFRILTVNGAGNTITYVNPAGVTETSSFTWRVEDGDANTRIEAGRFYDCRGSAFTGSGGLWIDCEFWRPMTHDMAGVVASFSIAGSVVTAKLARANITKSAIGRYVKISGATSSANNGLFKITSVTPKTGTVAATITYTNGSGITEAAPSTCGWWLQNGEKTGIGNGVTAISKAGTTVTFTASANAFSASDIGKIFRIQSATTLGNNGAFVITACPAANQVRYENAAGSSETYSGGWTIDSFDNAKDAGGNTYGSSHAIYYFAGRRNIVIENVRFYGVRTTAIKVSGSSAPIEDVLITGCYAEECGALAQIGADDSQEHNGISVVDCTAVNCANGRAGWTQQIAILVLGSRGTRITNNRLRWTHDAISFSSSANTVAGGYGIACTRYVTGVSQPLEDLIVEGNQLIGDRGDTSFPEAVIQTAIHVAEVGNLNRWRTAGTLTKTGSTMTLLDSGGMFNQELVGQTISLRNSASSNDVTDAVILSISGTTSLTYTNAGGTGGGVSAGTYRIRPLPNKRGSLCRISNNQIRDVGGTGINSQHNVGPEITGNVISGCGVDISETGSALPRIAGNRRIGFVSTNAGIRINSFTSWPCVWDNMIAGYGEHVGAKASRGDIGIGVDGSSRVDHPLLGKTGRSRATGGKPELVFAFGSKWVDGDQLKINGSTTFTYRESAPVAASNQFNGFLTGQTNENGNAVTVGLVNLLDNTLRAAISLAPLGFEASEFGSHLTPTCTTKHIRLRLAAQSTTVNAFSIDTFTILNATALISLRTNTGGGEAYAEARGEQAAGPIEDKTVVWSPMSTYAGAVHVSADNPAARTLLAAGFWRHAKNANNAGSCEVIVHDDAAGTEEFRWDIPS